MDSRSILIYLSILYKGDWDLIYEAITTKKFPSEEEISNINIDNNKNVLTILDDDYPEYLKNINKPPFVLFYKGDISLIKSINKNLAVVGSREVSPIYSNLTKEIVHNLNKDIVIVSGLARGIDGVALTSAIESNKKVVAIIANGLDFYYPAENRKLQNQIGYKGLLISEYPYGCTPECSQFPFRNRLIAAFANCVFVPQAALRSGSLITVAYALEQSKNVLCLPSIELNQSACNTLIKEGAFLVESASEINEFLK